MNRMVSILLVSLFFLFSHQASCDVHIEKDQILAGLEQFSAVLATSALVAQRFTQDKYADPEQTAQTSMQLRLAKTFVDAARLFNGVIAFYNQYAYIKNIRSQSKQVRMSAHMLPWIAIDAIKLITNFLPKKLCDYIEHVDVADNIFELEIEKKLYEWFENSMLMQGLRDYLLTSIEVGVIVWTACDYSDDSEDGEIRKLYLSAARGLSRCLQEFFDAQTITLKRTYLFLFLAHASFFLRDVVSPPKFSLDGPIDLESSEEIHCAECTICSVSPQIRRVGSVRTGCNHEFHRDCLEEWFTIPRDLRRESLTPERLRSPAFRNQLTEDQRNSLLPGLEHWARVIERGGRGVAVHLGNPNECPVCSQHLNTQTLQGEPAPPSGIGILIQDFQHNQNFVGRRDALNFLRQ